MGTLRLGRVGIGGRKAALRMVRQAELSLSDTIYAVPVSGREDKQAWCDASAVAVMHGAEVRPDFNRVTDAVLGVRFEAANARQVHPRTVGFCLGADPGDP